MWLPDGMVSARLAVLPVADGTALGDRGLRGGGTGGVCEDRDPFSFSVSSLRRSVFSDDFCEVSLECVGLSAGGFEPDRLPKPRRCHRSRVLRRLSIVLD